jgi:hypothetical protein
MKKLLSLLMVVGFLCFLSVSSAGAAGFTFSGTFELFDKNADGFYESIKVGQSGVSPPIFGAPSIDTVDPLPPPPDSAINGTMPITPDLMLDVTSFSSGNWYDFVVPQPSLPNWYAVDTNAKFIQGDFSPETLKIQSAKAGDILDFKANIFNIVPGAGSPYNIGDGSAVFDAFLKEGFAELQASLSLLGGSVWADAIGTPTTAGTGGYGSFSGVVEVVPEPATMLLLGSGMIGLAGVARRRKKKHLS